MSIELLSILANKERYNRFNTYIKPHTITNEVKVIIDDLGEYYNTITTDNLDWDKFSTWFKLVKHPMFKPEKIEIYDKIFSNITSTTVKEEDTNNIIKSFIERDFATQVADIALRTADGEYTGRLTEVTTLISQFESESGVLTNSKADEVTSSFEEIFNKLSDGSGLKWREDFLNKAIGPIRRGNLIIFGKRPETGGTTFCASTATYMAAQLDKEEKVLWFNNEQPGEEVKARLLESGLGWDKEKIMTDLLTAVQEYEKIVGKDNKIIVIEAHGKDTRFVEQKLQQYNAGLIIFDQLWKVKGIGEKDVNDVQKLTNIYNWGRNIAHAHCPVVAVHQVDGNAGKYIPMEMLYGSKTGVPGEADVIITMGRSSEAGEEMKRYINIPKNKLFGDKHTIKALRHGRAEWTIEPEIGRFKE